MLKFTEAVKYVCDFETTVYDGQKNTEVWAAATVKMWTGQCEVFNNIGSFLEYHIKMRRNLICYFHNLKFDGAFIIDYFIKTGVKLASPQRTAVENHTLENPQEFEWIEKYKEMPYNSYRPIISSMGQWYMIVFKTRTGKIIEFRDSLKLLPFSVKKIGKDFKTKHQKTSIEYVGERHAGFPIAENEKEYIKNDVMVVKEALEILFEMGLTELTIGASCMKQFKNTLYANGMIVFKEDFERWFPDLYDVLIDSSYGSMTAGEYIHKSYRGGWCYLVPEKANKIITKGLTGDVNSLYPSEMHSDSNNRYPVGEPVFFKGEIPEIAKDEKHFYYVRIKTRFYLKEGYLPFIQIKNSFLYKSNESLVTSDVYYKGEYRKFLWNDGEKVQTDVELTLTQTDFELLKEHYELEDFELLDGCYFETKIGIFDEYINYWAQLKQQSKGAVRAVCKLMLNNLYGQFAKNSKSDYLVPILDENIVKYFTVYANDKKPGFIAIGSAITSYARNFTIRTAQKNFYGGNKRGFIYADTDSIHCDLEVSELKGVDIHPTKFNHWKIESNWDQAIFARQKTYIERVTHEDQEKIEKPYYNIKCAGMPKRCKDLLNASLTGEEIEIKTAEEEEFLKKKRTLKDFKKGLIVPSKLLPKRIAGGIILVNTTYEMR